MSAFRARASIQLAAAAALVLLAPLGAEALTSSHITDADLETLEVSGGIDVLYVAEGRWGDNGTDPTFELNLGERTDASSAVQGQYAWGGSRSMSELVIDIDHGHVSFGVGDQSLSDFFGDSVVTDIFIRTRAVDGQGVTGTSARVFDLTVNGEWLGRTSSHAANGEADILHLSLGEQLGEVSLSGISTFGWTGEATGALQSRIAYQVGFAGVSAPVPEPTAAVVFGAGCFVLATHRRRGSPLQR
jgi:hypothetical protein